jgi:membrane protein implicated in regulation of membrane protease activity
MLIIAIWFAKDVLIFPSVWRAYDRSGQGNVQSIIGMRGTVEQKLNPSGYVKVNGALWQAELIDGAPPMNEGEKIKVQGIRGLTLLVGPVKRTKLDS